MGSISALLRVCLVGWACLVPACGGHALRTREARAALDAMRPRDALRSLNEELGVESEEQLPRDLGGDQALLLLDRAMILEALGRHRLASRDFEVADKAIELLDFSRNALHDLGRYLFSDTTGPYQAPAYEKLLINTMNMLSYLGRGDLSGARVEARRLSVMQKFLRDHRDPAEARFGPGSYLAGFVCEHNGEPDEALRYYDEALRYGRYRTLVEPVRRLARRSSYRTPRLRELLGEASEPVNAERSGPAASEQELELAVQSGQRTGPAPAAGEAGTADEDSSGELLVVISFGRVPAKFAQRIPIGLALTYASDFLSPYDQARANQLALQGLVTWINYPELGRPRGSLDVPEFFLDHKQQPLEGLVAIDQEARLAWERVRGAVIAAAITRLISRIVAGQAVQKAAGDGIAGLLLNLGTQATLTAVDTPDTRSWSTLPARMAVGRLRLRPGAYSVTLRASGWEKTERVVIRPGGWSVVTLTALG